MSKLSYYCATFGPIGHLPAAGTIASLIVYATVYALDMQGFMSEHTAWMVCSVVLFIAYFITRSALRYLDRNDDPREIVIDELVGSLCALIWVPHSISAFCLSFLFFRFFDIVKPWPINRAELLFGAWGVLIDDVIAGLFSSGIVYALWHHVLN